MKTFTPQQQGELPVRPGEVIRVEGTSLPVTRFTMDLLPFLELPTFLEIDASQQPKGEGTKQGIYHLRAVAPGAGEITLGFRHRKTGETEHVVHIHVRVA